MSKELGKVLKALRENCELTQKQMAEALHIERSTYTYYELGNTEPDLKSIKKIAQILNVDVEVLLPDDEGKPSLQISDVVTERKLQRKNKKKTVDMKDPKIYDLTKSEKDILVRLRALPEDKRGEFLTILDSEENN